MNNKPQRGCKICPSRNTRDQNDYQHNSSLEHRFNFNLFEYQNYRSKLVKDKHGIEISAALLNCDRVATFTNAPKGQFIIHIKTADYSQQAPLNFQYTIKNVSKSNIIITGASLLHPSEVFELDKGPLEHNFLRLCPGGSYALDVYFKLQTTVTSFKIPLGFRFQTAGVKEEDTFSICRDIVLHIQDFTYEVDAAERSPYRDERWAEDVEVTSAENCVKHRDYYKIPAPYYTSLLSGLHPRIHLNSMDSHIKRELTECVNQGLREKNYTKFFGILLWLEEIAEKLAVEKYNMSNVTVTIVNDDEVQLMVQGLAEKRPSLVRGDFVLLRIGKDNSAYEGSISCVNNDNIWIRGITEYFLDYLADHPNQPLDATFVMSRLQYERMHAAMERVEEKNIIKSLFPSNSGNLANRKAVQKQPGDLQFFNPYVQINREQRNAVMNIVNNSSGCAPYVVFGPPGTGKTVTFIEAVLQIQKLSKRVKVLICAPANDACDMLTLKLIRSGQCRTTDLIRIHSGNRDWTNVPSEVRKYSNYSDNDYTRLKQTEMSSYRIVVTTLTLIGKFATFYEPDYVFIDEAAQAMEPEALIPISLLKGPHTRIILAGDPKQLGPVNNSRIAAEKGLTSSLLARLMETDPLYMNRNPDYITMLINNYRSHPDILTVPNKLFYEDQLVSQNHAVLSDPIANTAVYTKLRCYKGKNQSGVGCAIEFCAVIGHEKRNGRSPSFYNQQEIELVCKYIEAMLRLPGANVRPEHIGVITPYGRQRFKISKMIEDKLGQDGVGIEVGTTEVFQGREKRIIIISTVRSRMSLLNEDAKYKLGFVKHPNRMNVAMTRAQSKQIVIGNPYVLGTDKNWGSYITECQRRQAYYGVPYTRRTAEVMNDIIGRMSNLQLKDSQYNRQARR